jgi:uncharacterized protein YecE (DUF72 family)
MMTLPVIHVGTSGFSYDAWEGSFYPEDLRADQRLSWYATQLSAVEINNTYYRMPKPEVVAHWAAQVPAPFRFVVKAPRRLTQTKDDDDLDRGLTRLYTVVRELEDRLGLVYFQLPPWARKEPSRLERLISGAPPGLGVSVELQHPSWRDDDVLALLRSHGLALVHSDREESDPDAPLVPTSAVGHIRLRRPEYDARALEGWATRIAGSGFREVYVFIKHEDEGRSPALARAFLEAWDRVVGRGTVVEEAG